MHHFGINNSNMFTQSSTVWSHIYVYPSLNLCGRSLPSIAHHEENTAAWQVLMTSALNILTLQIEMIIRQDHLPPLHHHHYAHVIFLAVATHLYSVQPITSQIFLTLCLSAISESMYIIQHESRQSTPTPLHIKRHKTCTHKISMPACLVKTLILIEAQS